MVIHTSTANTDISLSREFLKYLSDTTWAHGLLDNDKYRKCASKRKWNERDYHVQDRKYVPHASVKIPCATTQFLELPFFGPHERLHVVIGLSINYHL